MRVSTKLTLALAAAILVVLGANAVVRVKREVAMFEEDIERDSRLLGRAVAGAAARVWQRVGETEALELVDDANERESNVVIRWVWLDGAPGTPHGPEAPSGASRALASGREIVVRQHDEGASSDALYTYVPANVPGPRPGAIELRESLAIVRTYIWRSIVQASITTALLVGLCALVAIALGSALVGRPVRQLVAQARRIGAGDLTTRLHLGHRDEIGELAGEMNVMSDRLADARVRVEAEAQARLAAVEQLRHADRLTTVGKLAAGIAHEVGTPLNVISGHAQILTDEHPSDSSVHQGAAIIAQQARRVATIIRQLLDFARPRKPEKAYQDLAAVISPSAHLLASLAQRRDVELEVVSSAESLWASVDAGQIQQVLTNLVMNAIQASAAGGTVTIGLETTTAKAPLVMGGEPGPCVRLLVKDSGPGIPRDVLPRVFEPFFTTKETGEGTGLGLAVAHGIVHEHGGWIDVDTEPEMGTCFSVYLPLDEPP